MSFDPRIQDAFTSNVVGTHNLVTRVVEASVAGGRQIHYVHVSTAYVGAGGATRCPRRRSPTTSTGAPSATPGCGSPSASRTTPASPRC
nr:hypothetical protein [Angustibacter aerolatus]